MILFYYYFLGMGQNHEGKIMPMSWEKDLKPIFRPEDYHWGKLKADPDKCTGEKCGLCIENCPFDTWEMDENYIPRMKDNWACFSCYNCMVACPEDAISIIESYHVDSGFWKTLPSPLPARMPLEPRDAEGRPDQWTTVEKEVFTRRSVRNFSDKPVPEHLIKRVLEAGRFAPSAGNSQPWKFIVVTNKALMKEIDESVVNILNELFNTYIDDENVKGLAAGYETDPKPGTWDPRLVFGGFEKGALRVKNILLGAPALILIAGDSRAIGGPEVQVGICGQNIVLAAHSLGIKATWVGFAVVLNWVPALLEKLRVKDPFKIVTSVVLGYPKFKQEGVVPREFRPITWFREGVDGPDIEE